MLVLFRIVSPRADRPHASALKCFELMSDMYEVKQNSDYQDKISQSVSQSLTWTVENSKVGMTSINKRLGFEEPTCPLELNIRARHT